MGDRVAADAGFSRAVRAAVAALTNQHAQNRTHRHGRVLRFGRAARRSQAAGLPVVVAWKGPRSVVCAASYEARRYGVHSAMSVARALRLCPQAIDVGPDFTRYREVSRQVREIFVRHTDIMEPLSLDEAYLDVTANKTGLPSATEVAQTIRRQIREETGPTASAGVAPNKFLAKIVPTGTSRTACVVARPRDVMAVPCARCRCARCLAWAR